MKFKLKITKDILKRSSMCGSDSPLIAKNCAFALAFNELIPNVTVGMDVTIFESGTGQSIESVSNTNEQISFIIKFDVFTPEQRINMPEQEFDVEIPDEVIEYYYGDAVKAVQHLIDNPVLTPMLV